MTKTPGSAGAQGKLAFLKVLLDVRVGERSAPPLPHGHQQLHIII